MDIDEKDKMSISDKERLLTESERKVIIDGYYNTKKPTFIVMFVIILLAYLLMGVIWGGLFYFITNNHEVAVKQGIGCLIVMIAFTGIFAINHLVTFKRIAEKARQNKLYVKEARYVKTSSMYNITYLEMYINGQLAYEGYNLVLKESLKKDDKVIILQMKGRAWVYKARD